MRARPSLARGPALACACESVSGECIRSAALASAILFHLPSPRRAHRLLYATAVHTYKRGRPRSEGAAGDPMAISCSRGASRARPRRGHTFHEGHNAEGELVARCLHDGETLTGVLRGHRVLELSVCGKWERDSSESNEQAENIIKSTSPSRAAFSLLRHPPPWQAHASTASSSSSREAGPRRNSLPVPHAGVNADARRERADGSADGLRGWSGL